MPFTMEKACTASNHISLPAAHAPPQLDWHRAQRVMAVQLWVHCREGGCSQPHISQVLASQAMQSPGGLSTAQLQLQAGLPLAHLCSPAGS